MRDKAVEIMQEAGVDYVLTTSNFSIAVTKDGFDQSKVYTQLTADDVAYDAKGWTGNNLEELGRVWSSKHADRIFGIRHGEERPFMLDQDNEYKALFYADENL